MITAWKIAASDRSGEQHIADKRALNLRRIKHHMAGCVAWAMPHLEGVLAQGHRVAIVEWGDVALDALPSRLIVVAIALEPAGDDDERSLTITTRGDWGARGAAILAVDA